MRSQDRRDPANAARRQRRHRIDSPQTANYHSGTMRGSQPLAGQTLSRYRVIDRLARGGTGAVHKAEETRLGRTVAPKFRLEVPAHEPQAPGRFSSRGRRGPSPEPSQHLHHRGNRQAELARPEDGVSQRANAEAPVCGQPSAARRKGAIGNRGCRRFVTKRGRGDTESLCQREEVARAMLSSVASSTDVCLIRSV